MITNPLKKARISKRLKQYELAQIAGCSAINVFLLERGDYLKVSKKMIKAYEAIGLDGEQLAREYQEWRKVHRQRLLDKKID